VRRAVISGAGVVSPFGVGLQPLLDALAAGRAAVGPIRSFDASHFPVRVAGEVPLSTIAPAWLAGKLAGFGPADLLVHDLERDGSLRDRKVPFALLAAAEAWRAAGCGPAEQHASLSIAIGLEQAFLEDFAPIWREGAIDWTAQAAASLPFVRFRSPVDLAARSVRQLLELRGLAVIHASACAAGGLAVAHAAALVERGESDVVVCGGTDSMVNPLGIGGLARIGTSRTHAAHSIAAATASPSVRAPPCSSSRTSAVRRRAEPLPSLACWAGAARKTGIARPRRGPTAPPRAAPWSWHSLAPVFHRRKSGTSTRTAPARR